MTWPEREEVRRLLAAEENTVSLGTGGRLRVCLCYPNTYSVGMSNLGFQALYYLLNAIPEVRCERTFLPSSESRGPVVSLESQTPLGDFDVAAFSISFDPDVVNVGRMLYLSGIPVFSAERAGRPWVIAGGILPTLNPEPLAEIVDAFVIGEAEEVVRPLSDGLSEIAGARREEECAPSASLRTSPLAQIPGVYVPSFYKVRYEQNGEIAALEPPEKVSRRFVRSLDDWPCHSRVVTPEMELGGLFLVEISRGCARGCKFCAAGHSYRPVRYRSAASVLNSARTGLQFRDTIGLIGAAVSDHPQIGEICRGIISAGGKVSFASMRADRLTPELLGVVVQSGTKTLALAPEAGTERLRALIRKGLAEEQILAAAREAAKAGLRRLRLYFMVGLPGESEQDMEEIAALVKKVRREGLSHITVSACAFVPKPHTPFEREEMASRQVVRRRLAKLRSLLAGERDIQMAGESPAGSFLQGIISRGDRRLGRVLARLAEISAPRLSDWQEALAAEGLSGEWYAYRRRADAEVLPWAHIGA